MKTLFLLHSGTNSRDIFRDMIAGWRAAGVETIVWELDPHLAQIPGASSQAGVMHSSRILAHLIRANGIELCVGMWGNGLGTVPHNAVDGTMTSFYSQVGCRHLLFWLDAPHWACGGQMHHLFGSPLLQDQSLVSLINNAATAEEMRDVLHMGRVISSPYGINPDVFRPHTGVAKDFDVLFALGPGDRAPNAVMREELENDDPDVARIRSSAAEEVRPCLLALAPRFVQAGETAGRKFLECLLEDQLNERHRPALHRVRSLQEAGLDAAATELLGNANLYIDVTGALRGVETWERPFTFAHLAKRFRCATMGQCDLSAWGVDATAFGMVEYPRMAELYSRAKIGLNVMRWQDDIGLNIKPAEITASRTACLCAYREGLDALWSPDEVMSFQGPGQATELARSLLEDRSARRSLADAGWERTLRDHTWTDKANAIVSTLTSPAPTLHSDAGLQSVM